MNTTFGGSIPHAHFPKLRQMIYDLAGRTLIHRSHSHHQVVTLAWLVPCVVPGNLRTYASSEQLQPSQGSASCHRAFHRCSP